MLRHDRPAPARGRRFVRKCSGPRRPERIQVARAPVGLASVRLAFSGILRGKSVLDGTAKEVA
jgi:hypothetical protein